MDLNARAAEAVGYPIRPGDVLVMDCETMGGDHHGEEHTLPVGALAVVAEIEMIGGEQGLGLHLSIPVDPGSNFADDTAVQIVNTFDEGDTWNRFAFRPATPEERTRLHPSWLASFEAADL